MFSSDPTLWRTAALCTAALGQTAFALLYVTFPWWRTFLGRALFGKALALLLIMDVAAASRLLQFGDNDALFTLLYIILSLGVWAQFIAFLRVRLDQKPLQVSGNRRDDF